MEGKESFQALKTTFSMDFLSSGCNRVTNCADWGQNGIVAYGAGNLTLLYTPKDQKINYSLVGHQGRVNCLRWIPLSANNNWTVAEKELVTGSTDKTLIIWKNQDSQWTKDSVLSGHTDAVNAVAVLRGSDESVMIASCSSDGTIKVWQKINAEWKVHQNITFGNKLGETVALAKLPQSSSPLMAVGGLDCAVHLFVSHNNQFVKFLSLQGHQDWIRSLDFTECENSDLLLATSSQDSRIRVWRISSSADIHKQLNPFSLSNVDDSSLGSKGHVFKLDNQKYSVLLESILAAHDDWVLQVQWSPMTKHLKKEIALLSSSMDKSMMIWKPSPHGVWIPQITVGEMGGATALGFHGGIWGPTGNEILAHGYNGAFHLWQSQVKEEKTVWEPQIVVSGHFAPVTDVVWHPNYQYLVSVSEDQTTRCFAPWVKNSSENFTWHEISRIQIHGHNLNCLTFINGNHHRLVSGADEKVLRVFDAPQTFIRTFTNITHSDCSDQLTNEVALGANVPPLGLSNKPVFEGQEMESVYENEQPPPPPTIHDSPPIEEHLMQSTLWPEIHKLYGHPNELVCVASNYKGSLIASACKASQPSEAKVLIWETQTFKVVAQLEGHTLTVAQLEFSHDDSYLLSVSRDRQFCIYQKQSDDSFKLVHKIKGHERIIWSGGWSTDDRFVATGSRDKLVKVWNLLESCSLFSSLPPFKQGVTAVSWVPSLMNNHYLLAVGLESGEISVWSSLLQKEANQWTNLTTLDPQYCPVLSVQRLRWQDGSKTKGSTVAKKQNVFQLAAGSEDHSVRVFTFSFS